MFLESPNWTIIGNGFQVSSLPYEKGLSWYSFALYDSHGFIQIVVYCQQRTKFRPTMNMLVPREVWKQIE